MIGRTYLEHGRPVVVLARWGPGGGSRNVLIRRDDGTMTVRPFEASARLVRRLRAPHARGAHQVGPGEHPPSRPSERRLDFVHPLIVEVGRHGLAVPAPAETVDDHAV